MVVDIQYVNSTISVRSSLDPFLLNQTLTRLLYFITVLKRRSETDKYLFHFIVYCWEDLIMYKISSYPSLHVTTHKTTLMFIGMYLNYFFISLDRLSVIEPYEIACYLIYKIFLMRWKNFPCKTQISCTLDHVTLVVYSSLVIYAQKFGIYFGTIFLRVQRLKKSFSDRAVSRKKCIEVLLYCLIEECVQKAVAELPVLSKTE